MAFSVSVSGKEKIRSEPNVVPLCDVLLVLLIIFMVVTPLVQKGIDVRLPNAAFTTDVPENPQPIVLSIQKSAQEPKGYRLYLNNDRVTLESLRNAIEEAFLTVTEKKLYLRMDQDLEFGILAESILDIIKQAGIENIGIITDKKTEKVD